MNCHCYQQHGLSGLRGGLGERRSPDYVGKLARGSRIRVGFNFGASYWAWESDWEFLTLAVEGSLIEAGVAEDATVTLTDGWINDYMTISLITAEEFPTPESAGVAVQEVLEEWLPDLQLRKRDPVLIDAVPRSSANRPGTAQPEPEWTGQPRPAQPGQPKCPEGMYDAGWWSGCQPIQRQDGRDAKPSNCNWDSMEMGEYLACQLGVTKTSALTIGAAGALLVVVLISKLAK